MIDEYQGDENALAGDHLLDTEVAMRIKSLASEDNPNLADTRRITADVEFPD